jgi:hypothetical protein
MRLSQTRHSGNIYDSDLTRSTYASPSELQAAITELREAFPKPHIVELDLESLKSYGSSANSCLPSTPHSIIVRPESTDDVVQVVNISRKFKVPIVPYSGATSLEGHFFGVTDLTSIFPLQVIYIYTLVFLWEYLLGYVRHGSNPRDQWYHPSCLTIISYPITCESQGRMEI